MPNNFKVFENMKTKELKQDSQNRLMSPMPEGEILPPPPSPHTHIQNAVLVLGIFKLFCMCVHRYI